MLLSGLLACAWAAVALPALGSATGLNTIPTTDLVPTHSWILQAQNGNTAFRSLLIEPNTVLQSQYSVSDKIEAGLDYVQPPDLGNDELVFNAKLLLQNEDDFRPNMAIGIWNVTMRQPTGYYVTFSKTLNYAQQQRERFRAHHRRNRKLLGRRIHLGFSFNNYGTVLPFAGTDLQLNDSTVLQADWISGSGNAVTLGFVYVLGDQRTVINPALLYSNDTHRVDGFFLNISHQFNLR
jgi:hypothetical protein